MPTNDAPADLSAPIAVGRTAELFAWGDGLVLKLTRPDFPPHLADQEWRNARLAWELGAPAPEPIELLEVAGRRGVVFERLDGPTMLERILRAPWRIAAFGRQLAGLHIVLHALSAPALPSYHDRVAWSLGQMGFLPDDLKRQVWSLATGLPGGDVLCHADFHPQNILFTERGPVVIDWEGSLHGSPVADVAQTCLWMRSALTFGEGVEGWLARRIGRSFERSYLAEYNRLAPGRLEHLDAWIAVLAACRLRDDTRHELPHLLPLMQRGGLSPPSAW